MDIQPASVNRLSFRFGKLAIFKCGFLYAFTSVPGFLPGNVANILQKHYTTLFYGGKSRKEQGRGYPAPTQEQASTSPAAGLGLWYFGIR